MNDGIMEAMHRERERERERGGEREPFSRQLHPFYQRKAGHANLITISWSSLRSADLSQPCNT